MLHPIAPDAMSIPEQRSDNVHDAASPWARTRQILSGSELTPPRETIGGHSTDGQPVSFAFRYLVALAVLVVLTALVWAIWGMPAASAVLLALAAGLIASWLVL